MGLIFPPKVPMPSQPVEKTATGSFLETDANQMLVSNSGSDIVLMLENDGAGGLTFPVGSEFDLYRVGAGEFQVNKGASVVFESPLGDVGFKVSGVKNTIATIKKRAANTYLVVGGVKSI